MNKYTKLAKAATVAVVMGMTASAFADLNLSDRVDLSGVGRIIIDDNGSQDLEAGASAQMRVSDNVKAKLTVDLQGLYDGYVADDFDWESFVEEASVTYGTNALGQNVAIIIGKQSIKTKTDILTRLDGAVADRAREDAQAIRGAMGVRVVIDSKHFSYLSAAVSETAAEAGNFDLNTDVLRLSVNAEKQVLGMNAVLDASYEDGEYGISLALIKKVNDSTSVFIQTDNKDGDLNLDLDTSTIGVAHTFSDSIKGSISYGMDDEVTTARVSKRLSKDSTGSLEANSNKELWLKVQKDFD